MQNITPLHLAAKADALEVTELLLRHNAQREANDQAVRLITYEQMHWLEHLIAIVLVFVKELMGLVFTAYQGTQVRLFSVFVDAPT